MAIFAARAFTAAKNWLFGGNTVLRIGVLLLFIGLAFLLRYASERVTVPVEFRYVGVAAAALALLALGWRLRLKNAVYGLTLQGAGIAVLYLTSFAARGLHDLLPAAAVFGLLVLFAATAAALAVLQDAIVLACAAALGGFATPILVSTSSGDHVALFSYFALLNAGILLVAWFKAWRILNLIGFVGTFGIGFAWGIQRYEPDKFASTEPFLLLFFLTYVCIGLLFARRKLMETDNAPDEAERHAVLRWAVARTDYIDGTLMFGPPLVGFGLQYALVSRFSLGAAFSALGLGLFYIGMAYFLRKRKRLGLLMEVCLALGAVFATLAVPLAFDAPGVVSAIWALEGAGIYWLSLIQRRKLARVFSLALIALAALAYLRTTEAGGGDTLLVGSPLGAALLGAALLFCHRVLRRHPEEALTRADLVCLPALGVSGLAFLYLVAPLCFEYDYTAIAWALAGLGTLFAGLRLKSRAFLGCAFGIQSLGGLLLLCNLKAGGAGALAFGGGDTLLVGSPLGAALLGAALLLCHLVLRRHPEEAFARAYQACLPALDVSGLAFLYLVAPLCFEYDYTVIAWALAGLGTVFAGLRLRSRAFLGCAFGIQLLGGLLFLCNLEAGASGASVLASGWKGLLCAALIGLMLIASVIVSQADAMARQDASAVRRLGLVLLTGLIFINLALLFVLDWGGIGTGWAASGLLLLWLGLWQRQRIVLYFGAALEMVAGGTFLWTLRTLTIQFSPSGSWVPAVLALAATIGAWRIHHVAARGGDDQKNNPFAPDPKRIGILSHLLLTWGMGWWLWAVIEKVITMTARLDGGAYFTDLLRSGSAYAILFALSLSAGLWTMIARRAQWRALALFACGLPMATALWLLAVRGPGPFMLGAPVWTAFFIGHFVSLRTLADLFPATLRSGAHVVGAWLLVGVSML
ncbi:MAG: DUF2339 domain-containing protein, partial [Azoarcus sp.]|nr:DUF2339 domain-containing protein [Azoarcus sp.]